MVGGGSPDQGKCTVGVVVDGAAEIQIRGNNATMRNLSGQAPQWRQFQCTAPMPSNPGQFRFAPVDGRGDQQLIGDPRNGGAAVIRINDSGNGASEYVFDLIWGDRQGFRTQDGPEYNRPGDRGFNQDRGSDRQDDRRDGDRPFYQGDQRSPWFTTEQAIRLCQDSIRDEARSRFGPAAIDFRRTDIDNNPGRNDWVVGTIAVKTSRWRPSDVYRFSCSVNFDTGRLRTAHIGVPNY